MPVLTKINSNVIADDAITGDMLGASAYLANTATQNISGTYSENRMYTSDAYTLSGNATINSDLVLSSTKPTGDVVLTASGAYTITGTGTLSGGSMYGRNTVSGMTGELGSTVTQASGYTLGSGVTFPAGHIIQVVNNTYDTNTNSSTFGGSLAKVEISSATNYKGTINNVGVSNHVYIICSFQLRLEDSGDNPGGNVVISRGDTNLWLGPNSTYDHYTWFMGGGVTGSGSDKPTTLHWIDESPATGTNTYYVKGQKYSDSTTYIKGGGHPFRMILIEIQR